MPESPGGAPHAARLIEEPSPVTTAAQIPRRQKRAKFAVTGARGKITFQYSPQPPALAYVFLPKREAADVATSTEESAP